jgi:hypothetical protein
MNVELKDGLPILPGDMVYVPSDEFGKVELLKVAHVKFWDPYPGDAEYSVYENDKEIDIRHDVFVFRTKEEVLDFFDDIYSDRRGELKDLLDGLPNIET